MDTRRSKSHPIQIITSTGSEEPRTAVDLEPLILTKEENLP
jgi:hypothetical protein